MKTKFATLTLVALLSVAGTTTALAHQDYGEGTMYHNLEHVTSTTSQTTQRAPAPFGYAVGGSQARRIVTIDSTTRYLNVTRGEVVQINIAVNQRPIVSRCQRPNLSSLSGGFD